MRARTVAMPWGRLRVWEAGDGSATLLALHGLGGSGRYWAGLERHLGDRWRLVAPDLAGFGASSTPREPADRDLHLATIAALTDDGAPVTVVGHSLGAVLGLLAAGRHPERVAALAMVSTPYPAPRPSWDPARWRGTRGLGVRTVAGLARVTWPIVSLPAQALANYPAAVVRDYGRQSMRSRAWTLWSLWGDPSLEAEVRSAAASVPAVPVLLRHAMDDRSVSVGSLDAWSALLPIADAAAVPTGGHQFLLRSRFALLGPWLAGLPVTERG